MCTDTRSHTHTYTHSLQQFVKGTGSFVSQMADAVLNGLTGGRHSDFMGKFRVFEEKERKVKESLRMEVRTPPREKGSPETKTGSAASSDGDQLASGGSSGDHPGSVASGDSGRDHPGSVASSDGGRDRPGSVASSDGGRDRPGSVASSDGGRDRPGSVASSDGGRDRSGSVASGGSSREQTPLGPEKGVENVGECSDMQSTEVEECGDMEVSGGVEGVEVEGYGFGGCGCVCGDMGTSVFLKLWFVFSLFHMVPTQGTN